MSEVGPQDPPAPNGAALSERVSATAALAVLVVALVLFRGLSHVASALFSRWEIHDDEGYLLYTVRQFLDGSALYDVTYSHYGPFYYLSRAALHGPLEVSHEVVRWVTFGEWALMAAAFAAFVWRLTRAWELAALVLLQMCVVIYAFAGGPGHPQGLSMVLIGALLLGSLGWAGETPRRSLAYGLVGACVAGAALTKINVGGFLAVGVLLTGFAALGPGRLRVGLLCAGGALAILLPLVIMRPHLGEPWAQRYCGISVLSSLAVVACLVRWPGPSACARAKDGLWLAGGAALVGLGTLGFALSQGSTLQGLLAGILLRPLQHPKVFWVEPPLEPLALWSSVLSLGLALVTCLGKEGEARGRWLSVGKLAVGLGMAVGWVVQPALFAYGIPLTWLVLVPPREGFSAGERLPRALLATVSVTHYLVAFPIAGDQRVLATLPLCAVSALLVSDARRDLLSGEGTTRGWRALAPALCLLVMAWGPGKALVQHSAQQRYERGWLVGLPGSGELRIPLEFAATLRWTATNLRAHSDGFLSDPGLGSLHFWAERPHPHPWLTTTWWFTFDDDAQRAMVQAARTLDRPLVVRHRLDVWQLGRDPSQAAGVRAIDADYVPWIACGALKLLVRRDRETAGLEPYVLDEEQEFAGEPLPFPWQLLRLGPSGASLELWFKAEAPGGLVGLAEGDRRAPHRHQPLVYVGSDGLLRAQLRTGEIAPLEGRPVLDGRWHHLLITSGEREVLYLDGEALDASDGGALSNLQAGCLGAVYGQGWPGAPAGWFPFRGALRGVQVHRRVLTADEAAARASVREGGR